MAKRLYNGVYETDKVVSKPVAIKKDADEENISVDSKKPIGGRGSVIMVFVIVSFLLILFIVVAATTYFKETKMGGHTAQESIVGFITCLSDDSDNTMFDYIPKEIRSSGFLIDTAGLSDLQKTDEIFNINFTAITIQDYVTLSDVAFVMNDIKSQYHVDMVVTDAVAAHVIADYEYKDGIDVKTDVFVVDLISIKVNNKWFVCPGVTIPDDTFKIDSVQQDTMAGKSESKDSSNVAVVEKSVDTLKYIAPVEKEIPDVEPYKGILKDLQAGNVSIDGYDFVLPCPYLDMLNVFHLCYDTNSTALDTLTIKTSIKPNYILNDLPAVFTNLNYNMADLFVSIGNRTKENIYVDAGDVTMFYIGLPKSPYSYQIYDYPNVLLPGNVTLGTSRGDVEYAYGELTKCEDKSNVILYDDEAVVYAIQLDNSHNFIYFEFVDEVLVAIEWYYYDFNAYVS